MLSLQLLIWLFPTSNPGLAVRCSQAGSAGGWVLGMLCLCHHPFFLSTLPAPTPVTDIRTDKIEQKSVSLSWQEPGFPTTNSTEYEVKYYEKVGLWGHAQPLSMQHPKCFCVWPCSCCSQHPAA